jgi:hypothetical protein
MDGAPIETAVPLDEDGHQLAPDGTPVFLSYELYKSINFDVFNLDGINFPDYNA